MKQKTLRILQVNTKDISSGAERIARTLFKGCQKRGHTSQLVVGFKLDSDPDILLLPHHKGYTGLSGFWWNVHQRLMKLSHRLRGSWRLSRFARALCEPKTFVDAYHGYEDYRFSGTWELLNLTPWKPDIVHCHNLHGDYFDLRVLPWLSHQVPLVVTLHDMWLFTGYCTYSLDCERWKKSCGQCPLLKSRPSIFPIFLRKDGTSHNLEQKRKIYSQSRLYIATPSQWLMNQVAQSILAQAIDEARVIHNGMDLSIFHPFNRLAARKKLGIPADVSVLLSVASSIRENTLKGYRTMREASLQAASLRRGQRVMFIAVGANAPPEHEGNLEIRFVPFQSDPRNVALYYQAADLYIHGAKMDNFPNTILEALCCGTPVISTAVGGIPEQVKGAHVVGMKFEKNEKRLNPYNQDKATGVLVPPGNPSAMASAIDFLLRHDSLLHILSENAAKDARRRFDLEIQIDAYLAWYQSLIRQRSFRKEKNK